MATAGPLSKGFSTPKVDPPNYPAPDDPNPGERWLIKLKDGQSTYVRKYPCIDSVHYDFLPEKKSYWASGRTYLAHPYSKGGIEYTEWAVIWHGKTDNEKHSWRFVAAENIDWSEEPVEFT